MSANQRARRPNRTNFSTNGLNKAEVISRREAIGGTQSFSQYATISGTQNRLNTLSGLQQSQLHLHSPHLSEEHPGRLPKSSRSAYVISKTRQGVFPTLASSLTSLSSDDSDAAGTGIESIAGGLQNYTNTNLSASSNGDTNTIIGTDRESVYSDDISKCKEHGELEEEDILISSTYGEIRVFSTSNNNARGHNLCSNGSGDEDFLFVSEEEEASEFGFAKKPNTQEYELSKESKKRLRSMAGSRDRSHSPTLDDFELIDEDLLTQGDGPIKSSMTASGYQLLYDDERLERKQALESFFLVALLFVLADAGVIMPWHYELQSWSNGGPEEPLDADPNGGESNSHGQRSSGVSSGNGSSNSVPNNQIQNSNNGGRDSSGTSRNGNGPNHPPRGKRSLTSSGVIREYLTCPFGKGDYRQFPSCLHIRRKDLTGIKYVQFIL